ncbi:Imm74 family immunity protein [Anaeromyxobacter oryzisoli]|uniref:Imm74 family immunity protein n=1 Tax=Anaeromyxobacter oryzisoli TaxID=2925408 RepID=UPI0038CC1340
MSMVIGTTTDMLVRVNNKTVRGPAFVVSVPNVHRVLYEEGGRTASVEIEGGLGPNGEVNWLVYATTLVGWDPPHADLEMSVSKREEIIRSISRSLELLGMPHQVI